MNEQDRFELYQKLLASAAAQLDCEPTAEKAKDLATLRLMRESVTLKLIAGKDCNPSDLRWLTEELAKFAPPEPPIKVEIEIVNPTDPTPLSPPPDPPPSALPPKESKPSPPASSAPTEQTRPRSAGEPITDTMRRFNQLRGYGAAPDGRLGRGNPSRGGTVW
jgi:hypothetical protein